MTTYEGPATVIADSIEYEVTAQLTSASREWYGSLSVPDGGDAWAIFNGDSIKLRIGDRTAGFIPEGGGTDMPIQGSGQPPFGN